MSVTLRIRERKNKKVLFLDIYHNGARRTKYLKIYLTGNRDLDKPKMKLGEKLRTEEELRMLSDEHGYIVPSRMIFTDFLEDMAKKKNNKTWTTISRHWKAYAKQPIAISDLKPKHFEEYQQYLLQTVGVSKNTAWSYESRMNAALNFLVKRQLIPKNPMHEIDRMKQREGHRSYLTIDELQKLANTPLIARIQTEKQAAADEVRKAFIFSCYTGIRQSDILKLRRSEIQGQTLQLVQQKTGSVVSMPLHPVAWDMVKDRVGKNGPLFELPPTMSIWRWLGRWATAAGINKQVSFHTSRHTFAMLALSSSKDIYAVNKLLGHTKMATTEIYLKILDENKKRTVESMPSILV